MAFKSSLDYISNVHNDIYPATDPTKSDLSQPGKTVLITGAGRGIGRSIALRYAEAGVSSIVLCARTVSELDEVEQSILAINSKITVAKHQLDVSSATNVAKVASKVPAVDILVNNAGHGGPWILMGDSDPDAWWKTYEINIKGPYLMTRYFISKLPKGGQIINVSSIGADVVFPMASCYQTSKLALTRLSEFTQVEYPDIICLSLHPGGVLTQLSSEVEAIRPCK